MATRLRPRPSSPARNLLTALLGLAALSAALIPVQAGPAPAPPALAMQHVSLHEAAPIPPSAADAGTCPAPYSGDLPNCTCPPGTVGSFPTGCRCAPGTYGTPPSCSPCPPPPGPPGPTGGCTCPPSNPNCCPDPSNPDCCQNGSMPANHCCGAQYNPTGNPADCCRLYRTAANCCDTAKPSFDPIACVCVLTGVCPLLAAPTEQAKPLESPAPRPRPGASATGPPDTPTRSFPSHAAA